MSTQLVPEIPPDVAFVQYLAKGQFRIQRSKTSGLYFFYPRVAEPLTGSRDIEWVQASGGGTVYSATVVRQKPPALPYNVALIDLDEGPRLMSRVNGIAPERVAIGMRVNARILDEGDGPILIFEPA